MDFEDTEMIEKIASTTVYAQNLYRDFGGHVAVQGVGLVLKQGEVLGLLGPNGAGKTSTLRMLTGNLAPSVGSISICGVDLLDKPQDAKAFIGYLPETPPLYQEMTVDEYLRFAAKLHRLRRDEIQVALDRAKQRCGLSDMSKRLINNLSKGYQQRVGIAQAIIHSPEVIILDEPTAALGVRESARVLQLIHDLRERGMPVILISHNMQQVFEVADRIHIPRLGKRLCVINPKDYTMSDAVAFMTGAKEAPEERVSA